MSDGMEVVVETPNGTAIAVVPDVTASLDEVERWHVLRVLEVAKGNRALAAKMLKVDRKTLYRRLAEYGLPVAPRGRRQKE